MTSLATDCREPLEAPWEQYTVDSRRNAFDVDAAWKYLSTEAYWGRDRTRDVFTQQIDKALIVFGLFHHPDGNKGDAKMIGMARIVGDTDANLLMDVYVEKDHQGGGLGTKFIEVVLNGGQRLNWRWLLYTGDRMDWYVKKFGFRVIGPASRQGLYGFSYCIMERDAKAIKFENKIRDDEELRQFLSPPKRLAS